MSGHRSMDQAPRAAWRHALATGCSRALRHSRVVLPVLALLPLAATAQVSQCVAPAKPGGGFDLTCQLVQRALQPVLPGLRTVHQPGGIGALVYNEVLRGQRPLPDELIAFSSGTLLNLAQGRFGPHRPERVRWVAALALDHGVVAVHRDAPWPDLQSLLRALKANPGSISFATGGTIGSQDWMKAALLARASGVSHKAMRVVAFEGGGDAVQALRGRHVQVLCGDAAELVQQMAQGAPLRVLAVLAERRLAGPLAGVPTALEQGVALHWPILRGVYSSAALPPAATAEVARLLAQGLAQPGVAETLRGLGLQPLSLSGDALAREVDAQLARYRTEALAFGLVAPGR